MKPAIMTPTGTVRHLPKVMNRVFYGLFIGLVTWYVIKEDYESAVMNFGIALIFDPFDQQVKWQDRPLYQRVWTIVHVSLLLGGFVLLFLNWTK